MLVRTRTLPTMVLVSLLALLFTACSSLVDGSLEEARRGVITVDTPAYFAERATATANPGDGSWVRVQCFQGGALVYTESLPVDEDNKAYPTLGPTWRWVSGNADCTAEEMVQGKKPGHWRVVARTTFEAIDPNQ